MLDGNGWNVEGAIDFFYATVRNCEKSLPYPNFTY